MHLIVAERAGHGDIRDHRPSDHGEIDSRDQTVYGAMGENLAGRI